MRKSEVNNMDTRFTLNDLLFTPGPLKEHQREVDPNWDEEAALERSRKLREEDERLLREFEERTKDLVVS